METQGQASVPDDGTLIKAKVRMGVTRLFKAYLAEFEAFTSEHDECMKRLRDALPEQYKSYVNLADYLTDDKVEHMRRKVLGAGNDVIRDVETMIDTLRL